ncbi:MAG: HIT family protein [Nanoarchaeota archaeon]
MKKEKFDIKKLEKIPKEKCFICKHQIDDSDIIFESEKFIAFLDLYPPTKGYTILAIKKHMEDITELSEKEYLELQKILLKISKAIKKAFNAKRICLLNSGGLLTHLHFHIIPMYKEVYDNFIDIILKKEILKLSKEEMSELTNKIKDNL